MRCFALASFFLLFSPSKPINFSEPSPKHSKNALCILTGLNPHSKTTGLISFSQENPTTPTKMVCSITNLPPSRSFGLHIHEYGDLRDGASFIGSHFNPFNQEHGDIWDKEHHVGDLGNLHSDSEGKAYFATKIDKLSLFGEVSIVGRACVVNEKEDNIGRLGHIGKIKEDSGTALALGVIGISKEFKNFSSY